MKNNAVSRTLWSALLIVSLLLAACGQTPVPPPTEAPSPVAGPTAVPPTATTEPGPPQPATVEPSPETIEPPGLAGLGGVDTGFALYDEPAVRVEPAVAHEPIAPDLSNVRVPFILSEAQLERLARDGFVVTPGDEREFFTVYEQARYANVPIFVTSDSLLHTYHLLFDKVLRTAEEQAFIPLLSDLNQAVMERAVAQYEVLRGTGWEDAARRTVAFVGVAGRLLEPDFPVPEYAMDLVDAELALVDDAAGMLPSPIFPGLEYGEDYTQYIPRGHYTRSEALEAYFRSMMWYGRMTFRLETDDPEVGRAETRSALLLVHALRNADLGYKPALDVWADLYYPTVFFVGRSDDLTVLQYLDVVDDVYGPGVSTATLADEALLDEFIAQAKELPAPRILGMVIDYFDDEAETTKGLRLMGQRFVPDAYIFRQLMWRNVGSVENPRGLPKGLDLFAAMGSERAYEILDEMGETEYEN
ncbi:MAG TPA: DUF3160 domain-containing protein, partial [Anaerolineae bacterium]|nr:DUF3160 domain-containing protein [Anaerolineae bacterium]